MAKVTDIIQAARRRLGISAAEEPLAAHEAEAARKTLNDMLFGWVLDKTIYEHTEFPALSSDVSLAVTETLSITDTANEAVSSCLAIRLCDDYGLPQPPAVVSHCTIGKNAIAALQYSEDGSAPTASFDATVINLPSQRRYW